MQDIEAKDVMKVNGDRVQNQTDDWKKEVILNGQRSKLNDTAKKKRADNDAVVIVIGVVHVSAKSIVKYILQSFRNQIGIWIESKI